MRAPLLYLAYDGMLEPLGQSQVLATAWDIGVGIASGLWLWLCLRHHIGIVHARSFVPAVMALHDHYGRLAA